MVKAEAEGGGGREARYGERKKEGKEKKIVDKIIVLRSMYGNPRYSRWILDSTPWIQESSAGIRIPCQLTLDFAFLEQYSGFQCPGFRIPHVRKNFSDPAIYGATL